MQPIRILLVDGKATFLQAVDDLLRGQPDIEILGWARSGPDALAVAERLQPDLILLSWTLPAATGLQVLPLLKHLPFPPQVIVLTVLHDLSCYRSAALAAGADGFVCQTDVNERLLPLVRRLINVPVPAEK